MLQRMVIALHAFLAFLCIVHSFCKDFKGSVEPTTFVFFGFLPHKEVRKRSSIPFWQRKITIRDENIA